MVGRMDFTKPFTPAMWRVERQKIGSWLNRLRWKSFWTKYMTDDDYTSDEFSKDTVRIAKEIHKVIGWNAKTDEFMGEGWWYLRFMLLSKDYKEAYRGMLHLIYLDW